MISIFIPNIKIKIPHFFVNLEISNNPLLISHEKDNSCPIDITKSKGFSLIKFSSI